MQKGLLITVAFVAFVGCDQLNPPPTSPTRPAPAVETPAPAPEPTPVVETPSAEPASATISFATGDLSAIAVTAPATVEAGFNFVTIAGVPADAQSGGAAGPLSVRLPEAIEAVAAAGRTVKVTVTARAAVGSALSVAYSTAVAGNSGWQDFTLNSEFADYSFEWTAPAHEAANGDYVGFKADAAVEVQNLVVSVAG